MRKKLSSYLADLEASLKDQLKYIGQAASEEAKEILFILEEYGVEGRVDFSVDIVLEDPLISRAYEDMGKENFLDWIYELIVDYFFPYYGERESWAEWAHTIEVEPETNRVFASIPDYVYRDSRIPVIDFEHEPEYQEVIKELGRFSKHTEWIFIYDF